MSAPTKWTYGSANLGGNFHDAANFITKFHPDWDVVAMDFTGNNTVVVYRTAEPAAVDATPDLLAVAESFEVRAPDADGDVWLVIKEAGVRGEGAVNLGKADRIVAQVALFLEESRRAAVAKARGEA